MVDNIKLEGNFTVGNTEMVIVKTKGGASVMEACEYKKLLRVYKKANNEEK